MNGKQRGAIIRGKAMVTASSALALLAAWGCGEVTSLGENDGRAGGDSGSTDANHGGGSDTAAGGKHSVGEVGGGDDGGGPAGSGQGGDGVDPTPVPYPLNPTVPISADCSCADDALTCNAAGACVPRCEPGGVCAVWQVAGNVLSTLTSNDTLHFVLDGQHDDLGNPQPGKAGQQSLWQARYPDPAPTKVAALPGDHLSLLARVGDKTFVKKGDTTLLAVSDDSRLVERELPEDTLNVFVNSDGVFTLAVNGSISRLTLGADGSFATAFEELVPPAVGDPHLNNLVFASDRLWRQRARELCSFDFANLQAAPNCMAGDYFQIYGAAGALAVAQFEAAWSVQEIDVDNQINRTLWLAPNQASFTGTMADGFVTGWLSDLSDVSVSVLGRFPAEGAVKQITPLITPDVVRAMAKNGAEDGASFVPPAVTTDAVYWTQWIYDAEGPSVSRYIFRAPLPE